VVKLPTSTLGGAHAGLEILDESALPDVVAEVKGAESRVL
jgi:hypothetical protein